MSNDDHSGNDQPQDRGDGDKPTRDARGRWEPGYCPNPKGRPKKKPKVIRNQSDIHFFSTTRVDILTNGQKETMDRRTALNNKMFESAMKGKVSMQRFLYKEFEKSDDQLAALIAHHEQQVMKWLIANPAPDKPRVEVPLEVEMEIIRQRALLNHYYPGAYPPDGRPANDDDDDDDG
jgi:hypothetical protein